MDFSEIVDKIMQVLIALAILGIIVFLGTLAAFLIMMMMMAF